MSEDFFEDEFKDINSDFVSVYVSLLKGITDAPTEFQEAGALYLVSTAVGRRWQYFSMPEVPIFSDEEATGGKILNLWFILLGKSRITRKSTGVFNKVEGAVDCLNRDLKLPNAFSPEYLIKVMAEKKDKVLGETPCTWINDDCSGFFEALNKKESYMITADTFLCRSYDGKDYYRGTIARGPEYIPKPYITIFLASTTEYLPSQLKDRFIRQGFLNRFIFVPAKRKQRKPLRTKPLTEEERKKVKYIKEFLSALYNKDSLTLLAMKGEARKLYDEFEAKVENKIEEEDLGISEGYYGNLPNFVIRLACLYRIARMKPSEIKNYREPILLVEREDVERAIKYTEKAWKNFELVLKMRSQVPVSKPIRTREQEQEYVYQKIALKGVEGMSMSELYFSTKFTKDQLEPILEALMIAGRIKMKVFGAKTKGRPKVVYFAV